MKQTGRVTKSRSGCQRCKNRRVKCDETSPACQACVRAGYECPGYGRPLRWSRKHEVHTQNLSQSHALVAPAPRDVSAAPSSYVGQEISPAPVDMPMDTPGKDMTDDWLSLGLGLENYDEGLAYEDATNLMSQDLTQFTPYLFASAFSGPHPPGHVATPSTPGETGMTQASNTPPEGTIGHLPLTIPTASSSTLFTDSNEDSAHSRSVVAPSTQHPHKRSKASHLLHTFYRLSSPRTLPKLQDNDFVEYYFKHVIRLHSTFDSDLNPFRNLVAKYWTTSLTVSLTIQSMAIAHMVNFYPYLAPLGTTKRSQAWRELQKDLRLLRRNQRDTDRVLLSLLLLGISSSWLQGGNLGLQYLHITRTLIQNQLRSSTDAGTGTALDDFWASALVHWEMLASFVDPVPISIFTGHGMPALDSSAAENGPIVPHPWTGVGTDFHFALAEVGRVLRRRRRTSTSFMPSDQEQRSVDLDLMWLQDLERFLLTASIPVEDSIAEYKDPTTPKRDQILMAECFRDVALIETYRQHPQLLLDRLRVGGTEPLPFPLPPNHSGYPSTVDSILAAIAQHVLAKVTSTFLSSSVCRLQPLIIVACAGQLRLPDCGDKVPTEAGQKTTTRYDEVTESRYSAETRMLALSRKGPQAATLLAIDLIREVWEKLDNGDDTHWLEVMNDNGWQTILA